MPVDTARGTITRRSQKDLTEEELQDIERKRLKGELSCAECRRLKLKCDKKLPCGSCERRGCESICPLGVLTAGQGTRYVLADTEQLHIKIHEMSNRIRQLEDALAALQSTVSVHKHSLLSDELLRVKFGPEIFNGPGPSPMSSRGGDEDTSTQKTIDALGTLTLGSFGDVHYYGRSAGSEALMLKAGEETEDREEGSAAPQVDYVLQSEFADFPASFPFWTKPGLHLSNLESLENFLPLQDRALQLCYSYVDHGSYFFRPIKTDELVSRLCPSVYDAVASRKQFGVMKNDPGYPHTLATLYFVFALGALLDLTLEPYNPEAERYYDLGRAALSMRQVYDSPNLDSVRAVGLMATYHSLAGKKYTRESAWCLMSIAAKISQTIGLHRDSARWNMDAATVQKRRNLFWEIFSADVSHSLAIGRPPAIHLSYVDCEFPQDEDASLSDDMEHEVGFWRMKHVFARDIYNSVAEATLAAKSPSYDVITDLDKKVKGIEYLNISLRVSGETWDKISYSSSLSLRDFYASQNGTVTMLYLHRSFFAQAMLDHAANPLTSPFAQSFLTAFRSASVIIDASAMLFRRCAAMATRIWFLMYHMFSAAVILGTIVARCPKSSFVPVAMRDFNVAVDIFKKAAEKSERARIALGVLLRLQAKAVHALGQSSPPSSCPGRSESLGGDDMDDLAIFGGQLRVLDRKGKQIHQTTVTPSLFVPFPTSISLTKNPITEFPKSFEDTITTGDVFGSSLPDLHPSLIEYLNQDAVRRAISGQRSGSCDEITVGGECHSALEIGPPRTGHGENRRISSGTAFSDNTRDQDPFSSENNLDSHGVLGRPNMFTESQFLVSTKPPLTLPLPFESGNLCANVLGDNQPVLLNFANYMVPETNLASQLTHNTTSDTRIQDNKPDRRANPAHISHTAETEIGTGGSWIDEGWVSFMRECGIMDVDNPSESFYG